MTAKTGVFEVCSGFLSENPRPETLAGHVLRAVTGVFGVLFQLLGNFLKITNQINLIIRLTRKNFQRPKKPLKPQIPRFGHPMWMAIQYGNVMKTLYGEQQCLLTALCEFGDGV
jgi:hypothetical protein